MRTDAFFSFFFFFFFFFFFEILLCYCAIMYVCHVYVCIYLPLLSNKFYYILFYILHTNRAVQPTSSGSDLKLCSAAPETRQQFVAECSVYERERNVFKDRLYNNTSIHIDLQDPGTFTRVVLDSSAVVDEATDQSVLSQVELYAREYIHEIHKKKVAKLKQISTS